MKNTSSVFNALNDYILIAGEMCKVSKFQLFRLIQIIYSHQPECWHMTFFYINLLYYNEGLWHFRLWKSGSLPLQYGQSSCILENVPSDFIQIKVILRTKDLLLEVFTSGAPGMLEIVIRLQQRIFQTWKML